MKLLNKEDTKIITGAAVFVWLQGKELNINLTTAADMFVWTGGLGIGNIAFQGDGRTRAYKANYTSTSECEVKIDTPYESYILSKQKTGEGNYFRISSIV